MEFLNKHIHSDFITEANKIPDNTIDLTVTSPPYDDIRSYNDKVKTKDGEKNSFNFDGIVDELYRITKDGGVVVWVVGDQVKNGGETGNSFRQALSFISKGFLLYDTMIYMKNGAPFPEKRRYSQVFEYMFVFSKGVVKTHNSIMVDCLHAGLELNGTTLYSVIRLNDVDDKVAQSAWNYDKFDGLGPSGLTINDYSKCIILAILAI